jgi:hypothetical protein
MSIKRENRSRNTIYVHGFRLVVSNTINKNNRKGNECEYEQLVNKNPLCSCGLFVRWLGVLAAQWWRTSSSRMVDKTNLEYSTALRFGLHVE